MSWIAKILGTDKAIKATAQPIEAVGGVLDKLFTSKEEKLNHEALMARLKQRPAEAQIELNKLEANHRTVFVAGWRPFIGWVCGFSLGFYFIPQFAIGAYLWATQTIQQGELLPYPNAGAESLFELVLALLGMATIRTIEKLNGASK